MAFGYERPLGCSHKAVLGVVIYEYALFVAHLVRERDVTVGEQHLGPLLIGKVESVIGYAGHLQRLDASYFHCKY